MRFVSILFVAVSLLTSGCEYAGSQNQPNVYFDVLSLIKGQIADLSLEKPLVQKKAWLDTTNATSWQSTRDINWNREFEMFAQADINKAALRSSYQVIRPDSLTYRYVLKDAEEHLPVRLLTVRIDSLTQQPSRLEAVLQTQNPLYSSERHLVMTLGMSPDQKWRVQHYKVSGYQKLAFFDKNQFGVEGYLGNTNVSKQEIH